MRTESVSWALSPVTKLFGFLAVLGLVGLGLFSYYVWLVVSDNLGTFHNTADLADLDGDGDLDVIVHNVRTESEFTAFSGTTLWFNQGDGQFVARRLGESGWASAGGDVDQDGDADLVVFPGWHLRLVNWSAPAQPKASAYSRRLRHSLPRSRRWSSEPRMLSIVSLRCSKAGFASRLPGSPKPGQCSTLSACTKKHCCWRRKPTFKKRSTVCVPMSEPQTS